MMSTDELYDQINADEKVILDSIGTDEKGWPTPPMAPLEVLVRYTVFGEVYGLIDDDYFNIHTDMRAFWECESEEERVRLEAACIDATYDEYDVAEFAASFSGGLDACLDGWTSSGELSDIPLERRGLGETREQVKTLAEKFLEELM